MNNFISYDKELKDSLSFIKKITPLITSNSCIVNCQPEFSSRLVHLVNHKLSYLNKNNLFEILDLEIPTKGMNQVWDKCKEQYVFFDLYLTNWVHNLYSNNTYLIINTGKTPEKYLNKIKLVINNHNKEFNYYFLSLYGQSGQDIYIENINNPIFEWENTNNKLWKKN